MELGQLSNLTTNHYKMPKPKFDFTINLGHIVQVLAMIATGMTLYFRMDTRLQLTERDISLHTKQIDRLTAIQESQDRTLTILTTSSRNNKQVN